MKKKIINGLLLVAAIVVATSTFVSCKDYDGDNYAELREQIAAQDASLQSLQTYLQQQITRLEGLIADGKCTCDKDRFNQMWNWYQNWQYKNPADFFQTGSDVSDFISDEWLSNWLTNHGYKKDDGKTYMDEAAVAQYLADHQYKNLPDLKIWLDANGYHDGSQMTWGDLVLLFNNNEQAMKDWLDGHGYKPSQYVLTWEELKTVFETEDQMKNWLEANYPHPEPTEKYVLTWADMETIFQDPQTLEKWLIDHGFNQNYSYELKWNDLVNLFNTDNSMMNWLKEHGIYELKWTDLVTMFNTENQMMNWLKEHGIEPCACMDQETLKGLVQQWILDQIEDNASDINDAITNIINQYITNNQYITRNDVTEIVNNLLKEYYTKTEVTNLLKNYITNEYLTQNYYTKEEVVNLINQASQGALTEDDVKRIINENVDFTPYVKKDELNGLINNYFTEYNIPDDVKQAINNLIVHPDLPSLDDYIDLDWLDDKIQKYLDEKGITGCSCDLSEYAKKEDVYTKSEVYTKGEVENLIKDFVTMNEVTTEIERQLGNLKNIIFYGQGGTAEDHKENSLIDAYLWAKAAYEWVEANKDKEWLEKSVFDTFKENYETAKVNWDKAWDFLKDGVKDEAGNKLEINTVQDLYDALKNACSCEDLSEEIDALDRRLTTAENTLQNLTGALKKQITGININGTYNPVFGTGSLPFSLQSNVLATHYGKVLNNFLDKFPTYKETAYYTGESVFDGPEFAMLQRLGYIPEEEFDQGYTLVVDSADNAGRVYLTVNPNTVDFTGTTFDLYTTDNMKYPVTLGRLTPSSERLSFGYTRGASANGFYVAKAKMTYDQAHGLSPYQKADLKEWASEIKSLIPHSAGDIKSTINNIKISEIANMVYRIAHEVKAPRLGVKAVWSDYEGQHSFVSDYDLAAVAIHPLNFKFLYEQRMNDKQWIKHITGSRIKRTIINALKEVIDIDNLSISEVHVVRENSDKYDLIELALPKAKFFQYYKEVHVLIDGEWKDVWTKNTNTDFDPDEDLWYEVIKTDDNYVYINVTPLADMVYEDLNTALEPYNESVGDFNEAIENIVPAIEGIVNRYVKKANKLIDNINAYINRTNLYLQPGIFARTAKNWHRLSDFYLRPTATTAGVTIRLVPTTWTLEYLAPAFMKHVVVSNVYMANDESISAVNGNANCLAALKKLNDEMGGGKILQTILPGMNMTPDASMKGMIIEIAYTAMDYEGNVAGDKFYVLVK